MGNSVTREKGRHASGEDSGPTMHSSSHFGMFDDIDETNAIHGFGTRDGGDLEPMPRMRASTITKGVEMDRRKLPTVFKWQGGGKAVYISGSFDNWKSKIPMAKSHGDFFTIVDLPEGTHEYKFLVDGQWMCDPKGHKIESDSGTENNKIDVNATDFEVFEALAVDSVSTGHGLSGSPPGDYTQDIPPRHVGQGLHHSGPPILPPHLLQVILNKETSMHCEPTLLPEPNHVMLNHLYALSIKDGVMVLSATHRYRKKYVTTLLYKPI